MPVRFHRKKTIFHYSEHEYEPIGAPPSSAHSALQLHTTMTTTMATAPVVRITDTDVVPVADSDDSIDDRTRLPPELTKDMILPLDGKIEDSAMEGRELVETGDTSEEIETPQEFQDRLEERFLNAPTPGAESRTDAEVNTSQVDSLALEELPLRRGARGLPQRIKTQAGKLRSRLRSIQRPTFAFASRQKAEKPRSTSSGKSDRSRPEKRPSRMDRIRSSFSERPRFSLPSRPKFNLPDRPKFHMPERPKFNIKKPNIRLPAALSRIGNRGAPREQEEHSSESTVGTRRHIFNFSTYPRIFDKQAKSRSSEYTTSTPKDSRAQSTESATFPRSRGRKTASGRWTQPTYEDDVFTGDDSSTAVDRSHPWRHPSLEEPRLSIRMEAEVLAAVRAIPWEEKRHLEQEEEMQYMDYEQEAVEVSEEKPPPRFQEIKTEEVSYEAEEPEEPEEPELDPRHYTRGVEKEMLEPQSDPRMIQRSRSLDEQVSHLREDESYEENFVRAGRRHFVRRKMPSEEEYEGDMDADEERDPSSLHSDREQQQSSGSSCDRRRRGVIEEIDSDEFFLRESGLSQDDMNLGKYLTSQIRNALRAEIDNALADEMEIPLPPQRPVRTRSISKRKEDSVESYEIGPPARPRRDRGRRQQSTESGDDASRERRSESRHRIVYQAEGSSQDVPSTEPLDDIVVVKPVRRKSKSSLRSHSQIPMDTSSLFEAIPPRPPSPRGLSAPPVVPTRRKRSRQEVHHEHRNGDVASICNGHTDWAKIDSMRTRSTSREAMMENQEVLTADDVIATSHEDIHRLAMLHRGEVFVDPAPVPPKRRSRSRGTSVAQDEDRTSHGAESLPEAEYTEDGILRDDLDSTRDLPGYAIIEKREKPPRPPPPRRKRGKFATLPKPVTPKRPQRAYSTLRPTKSRETSSLSESMGVLGPRESSAYIEIDASDAEKKLFHNGEVLEKIQGRPLPPPPRPPRARKERSQERELRSGREMTAESTIATQTDPLPDDMIIEEEITQAKLIVAPSRSGSQVLVSTERIPSPTSMRPPPVPALPVSQRLRTEPRSELAYDTVSLKSSSPMRECEDIHERPHLSAPHLDLGQQAESDESRARIIRSALMSDETLRIANLEVGDLRVDRLSVSQIEASKIVASEVDALVITASELKGISSSLEDSLSPSIISELIAIKHHLEAVASQSQQARRERSPRPLEERKTTLTQKEDIPLSRTTSSEDERRAGLDGSISKGPLSEEEAAKFKSDGDEKVVKTDLEVEDQLPVTPTLALIQVEVKRRETTPPLTRTLSVSQTDKDNEPPTIHSPQVAVDTEDKSLRILDSETTLSLTSDTAKEYELSEHLASQLIPLSSSPDTPLSEARLELPEERADPDAPTRDNRSSLLDDNGPVSTAITADSEESWQDSWRGRDRERKSGTPDSGKGSGHKSRSRSPSPRGCSVRQTASPVRSLPPAISVTPDTPDVTVRQSISSEVQPQRAVISYSSREESFIDSLRESSQSPVSSLPIGATHFIAFPASQVPSQLLSIGEQSSQRLDDDPSITDTTYQLIRALRLAGIRAMRHFVGYLSSIAGEETLEKIREVEVTLCALLLLVAGLLVFFFSSPRTVTHHHHWDYYNPPQ